MGGFIRNITGKTAAKRSARAIGQATEAEVGSQTEALDYLKEAEAIPRQFREGALTSLAGLYGLEGGEGDQAQFIEQARQSPLYEAILGGREAGEEAILRTASATGGLRSGNTIDALSRYSGDLENRALLESYNQQVQGLQGLSGLPSNVNQIAGGIRGIGETQGAGILGATQSELAAKQQGYGNLMSLGMLGVGIANIPGIGGFGKKITGFFSDIRLKKNIKFVEERNGINRYEWDWNELGEVIGLEGHSEGVMAHEVFKTHPEVVSTMNGWVAVDYEMLEAA